MTSTETVVNRALSGAELKQIIRAQFEKLLADEGMLNDYVAYGRVGYDIRFRLHTANAFLNGQHESNLASKPIAHNIVDHNPEMAALDVIPLPGEKGGTVSSVTMTHEITSPNAERIREGIPVPVNVRQADGTVAAQLVKYPPDERIGPANVTIVDESKATRKEFGLLDEPQEMVAPE